MPTATEMVAQLEKAIATQPGVASITVDGQTVTYNRKQLLEEYAWWKRQLSIEKKKRPCSAGLDLGKMW